MNTYFKSTRDFDGSILFYKAPEDLGFKYEGIVTSTTAIKNAMNAGKFAHLHVLNGRHWVLATGFVTGGYSVMDPGNAKTKTYKYSDVVGCAIYKYSSSKSRLLSEQEREEEEQSDDIDVDVDTQLEQSEFSDAGSDTTVSQNDTPSASPSPAVAAATADSHSHHHRGASNPIKSRLRRQSGK